MLPIRLYQRPITHLHLLRLRLHRQRHNHRSRQDQAPSRNRKCVQRVETRCVLTPSTVEVVAPDCANMDTPCYNTSVVSNSGEQYIYCSLALSG